MRNAIILVSHGLVHFFSVLLPFFLVFFPAYSNATGNIVFIALTLVLCQNAFGYTAFLIAKNKERILSIVTIITLLLNILLLWVFLSLLKVSILFCILPTLISYFFYVAALSFHVKKALDVRLNMFSVLRDVAPWKIFFPFIFSISIVVFRLDLNLFILSLVFFVLINFSNLIYSIKFLIRTMMKQSQLQLNENIIT